MSFHEISIAVRAENRTASTFRSIALDVANLGAAFGVLSDSQVKAVSIVFTVVRVFQSSQAILKSLTAAQTAQNIVVGTGAGVQTTFAISTSGAMTAQVAQNTATQTGIVSQTLHAIRLAISSAAHSVYAAACWVATFAQNALNISAATFLALTVVGIAVVAAATVAMFAFASSMNAATSSTQGFNSAAGGMYSSGRNVQRAGEAELYRRGVE